MTVQRNSIRIKLLRGLLLTSGIVLFLMFASYLLYEIVSYRSLTERQLRVLGNIIASNATAALAFDDPDEASEILRALKAETNLTSACLFDSTGKVFAVYPGTLQPSAFEFSEHRTENFSFSTSSISGYIPVMHGDKQLGLLYINRNTADINARLSLYTIIAFGIMSICFVLAYLLSMRLQKQITTPIVGLAAIAREVSQRHDYSVRAKKISFDETGFLTDAFNTMLSRIEIQNRELENARHTAHQQAIDLEIKVQERTQEYKRQKDFAEVVVNSSFVLMAVFDMELRILTFNKKCEEEFGLRQEDVLGKRLDDVLPSIKGSLTYSSIQKGMRGEFIHNPVYKSAVTGFYYESFTIPLRNDAGDIYAVLMTAHNITPLIVASENFRTANFELQRRNAELEQFAYVASHDLQEPLRKIQTFMQLTRNNFDNRELMERYMTKIEHSAMRMSSLIKDVLEYSRLSRPNEAFSEVDLSITLENVKSDFELLISQRNATITYENLPVIQGHKLQIHQLFSNLVNNAIKFCDRNPLIQISAQLYEFSPSEIIPALDKRKQYVQILFTDNGIGFESQYAEKIFTIFQRLNTREKYEGTGIGLALCKKIVENHNGYIDVTSKPGEGTTFRVILPLKQDEAGIKTLSPATPAIEQQI